MQYARHCRKHWRALLLFYFGFICMSQTEQSPPIKTPRQRLVYQHQDSSLSLSSIDDEAEEGSAVVPRRAIKKMVILQDRNDEAFVNINQNSWLLILKKLGVLMDIMSKMPLPPASVGGIAVATLLMSLFGPKSLVQTLIYPAYRHCIGGLYPAYASYKAVRSKNVREYVKWMMYWIVLAVFGTLEQPADLCLGWLPFYYEVKILMLLWLLSPTTKGSSMLYKKVLHPALAKREQEIDEALSIARDKGYRAVLQLGSKATNALLNTAIKSSGNLMHQLRKTHSLSDIPEGPCLQDNYIDEQQEDWSEIRHSNTSSSIIRRRSDIVHQRPLSFTEDNYVHQPKISRKTSEESSGYSSSTSMDPKTHPTRTSKDVNAISEDVEEEDQNIPGNIKSYIYKNVTITDVTNLEDGFLVGPKISDPNWSKFDKDDSKTVITFEQQFDKKINLNVGKVQKVQEHLQQDDDDDNETFFDTSEVDDSFSADNIVSGNISIKIREDKRVHVYGKGRAPDIPTYITPASSHTSLRSQDADAKPCTSYETDV